MKKFIKNNWHYILAFLIPCLAMFAHIAVRKIWFMGENGILQGDLLVQIYPIYNEIWNKVHSGASLIYTWNIGGGVDFYSVIGYLFSPFSLLILAAPKASIGDMLQLTVVCKWALASLSAAIYFHKTHFNTLQENRKLVALCLGLAFGMGNGVTNLALYPQNMEPLICFPILLLLLEDMFEKGKWKLYYIVLTFSMLTSIYTSFAVCIFLCLWFVLLYNNSYKQQFKSIFIKFAGASTLSAMTSFVCIYLFLVSSFSRAGTDDASLGRLLYIKAILVKPLDFLRQFFVFGRLESPTSLKPNLYMSVIGISLVAYFVFVKMDKLLKIKIISLLILMVASILFGAISIVWHAFNAPNGVYHRHVYMLIFVLLFLLMHVVSNLGQLKKWNVVAVALSEILLFVVLFFTVKVYEDFQKYFATIMLIILLHLLLFFFCKGSITGKVFVRVLAVLIIVELCANSYVSALKTYFGSSYDNKYIYGELAKFADDMSLSEGERISSALADNSGPIADLPCADGFLSNLNQNNLYLQSQLGLSKAGNVMCSLEGATPLINLMYNVRYGVALYDNSYSDVEEVLSDDGIKLFRMKRLAGLGYMVNEDLLSWDIENPDCFSLQNDYVRLAVDGDDFFTPVDIDLTAYDATGEGLVISRYDDKSFTIDYVTKYGSYYDSIQAGFIADHDMDLYVYTVGDYNVTNYYDYSIYMDDEMVALDERDGIAKIIYLGNIKKGQKVTIVRMPEKEGSIGDETEWGLHFVEFNDKAYNAAYEKLSKNTLDVESLEADYVKGKIHADESGLMMTSILADKKFTAYVDGEEVPYETVGNTFIALPLEAGDHVVELRYSGDMLVMGIMGSVLGLLFFALACFLEKKLPAKKAE